MISTSSSSSADLTTPLPSRQFRGFLLFFHLVFLAMVVLTLYAHLHRVRGAWGRDDIALVGLVTTQILLYLFCFALPTLADLWPAGQWFGKLFKDMNERGRRNYSLALRFWAVYIAVSVAIVLAESRIDGAFQWALVAYVGQVSALPFRISVPATVGIFAAYLLNRFGWTMLTTWGATAWFDLLVPVIPSGVLLLFMGRIIVTSGERGKLIAELQAAKQALELARQRDAELAALRERERLARDLHDNLGHSLVTMTVQLEAAQRLLSVDSTRAAASLEEMKTLSRSSMESLRRSLANLRAPGLGDKPLTQALRSLCDDASRRTGLKIDCQVAEGADGLPPAVAEVVWHVAQEGLTNVEKHAQAQQATVSLGLQPQLIVLRVGDDGVGLPPDAERKPGHYGLRGMRERVEGVGGTLLLTTAQPKGTIVEARVPLIA
jgi:signal transduction histidine kinase